MANQDLASLDDLNLWKLFKKGSIAAFNLIYKRNYRNLINYGFSFYSDKEFVKDNLQELLYEIWRDRKKLGEVKSIKIYLIISFRRKMLYNLNRIRKQLKKSEEICNEYTYSDSLEEIMIQEQEEKLMRIYLDDLIEKLPPRQKEALNLRYIQELTYEEIMRIMSLKYQTVRDLVYKAIKTLRKEVKQKESFSDFQYNLK